MKTLSPNEYKKELPISRIAIIGGGRWARVIAGTLVRILPHNISLSVHSRKNVSALESWSSLPSLKQRLTISDEWPELNDMRDCAVIVVNAARDHADSVRRALEAGAPVIVEKPAALTAKEVQSLIDLSINKNVRFATAHIFMFARYLENFKNFLLSLGTIHAIRIRMADPGSESRYGDDKKFDQGLPLYADWIPHAVTILNQLTPGKTLSLNDLQFSRGGAHLILCMNCGNSICCVDLERNYKKRERHVEVELGDGKTYQLDFSSEPGQIFDGDTWTIGDLKWNHSPRPVESMLRAFLQWISSDIHDPRLDYAVGLLACQLIDQTRTPYVSAQSAWLTNQLSKMSDEDSESVDYALSELIQASGRLPEVELMRRINYLRRTYAGSINEAWIWSEYD